MDMPQSINAETGRKLRALRLRAHLSMRELARQAGVAVSYVSNLEAGRVSATLATLRKLLVALGSDLGPFFSAEQSTAEGLVFRRQQMQTTSDAGRSYTFILPSRADIRFIMLDEATWRVMCLPVNWCWNCTAKSGKTCSRGTLFTCRPAKRREDTADQANLSAW